MTDPATVAGIAGKLTKAQREAINTGNTRGHLMRYELHGMGLCERHEWSRIPDETQPIYAYEPTPLGLAVRAYLEKVK